jgi:outer membrane protein assembly factor BamB
LFCAEGICQGPPLGTVEPLPARAFARSESVHVRVRVDRAHGTPAVRILLNGAEIAAQRQLDGVFGADVPLSLAPAGIEGAVPLSVEVRDDLGHVTALGASVLVDDRAPRLSIQSPAGTIVRGTAVSVRVKVEDMTAVLVSGGTKQMDGSFVVIIDTRTAPPAASTMNAIITATDAVGNVATAHVTIQLTRLKFSSAHPANGAIISIALSDSIVWAMPIDQDVWLVRRSDGATIARPTSIAAAFPEIATDGLHLFYARADNQVCRIGSTGTIELCCGPYATLTSGPALFGSTPLVTTTGSATTSTRLFAIVQDSLCYPKSTLAIADFVGTTAAIASNGTVYSGANQAVVAAQFDGLAWNAHATPESPHYRGQPAFRSGAVLFSTTASTIDSFAFTTLTAPPPTTIQVASVGTTITSPTIAPDGTLTVATDDRRVIALRANGSVRWTATLPDSATAPPTHGAGGLLYLGTGSGDILALNETDGSTVWTWSTGAPIRGPLAPGCDGVLYAASGGTVIALVIDAVGLANSPWPKAGHDVRGTSDARRPLRSATGACLE